MQVIKEEKKVLFVFLSLLISFGIFNFFISNYDSEITYYDNCSSTFSKELKSDRATNISYSIEVMYEQVPIYPELQNIKCLNKIIGKTFDLNDRNINYYVGYSQVVLLFQGFLFLIFLLIIRKFILKIDFIQTLFFINTFLFLQFYGLPAYIFLTQIIKLNLILLVIKIFHLNSKDVFLDKKINQGIQIQNHLLVSILFTNIALFIFFEHLKNFYYENYMIHFSSWTINYTGGLNRRGFIGEILTLNYIGVDIRFLVSLFITLIYTTILYNIWKIFKNNKQNYISILMMISPFYLLFVVNDFRGGNFKEILGLLAFTFLVLYNSKKRFYLIVMSTLLYTFSIFSHTVNLFIFPIIIFYIYKFSNISKKNIFYTIYTSSVLTLVGLIFSPLMTNLYFDSKIWCANLIKDFKLTNSCSDLLRGSMIDFKMNASFLDNIQYTFSNLNNFTFLNYIILFLLANFYIVKTKFFIENKRELFIIYLSFLPLFIIALDWGRWIYILFFCLFTIYISIPKKELQFKRDKMTYLLFSIPTFLIYVPHCCANSSITNIIAYNLDSFHLFDVFFKLYKF